MKLTASSFVCLLLLLLISHSATAAPDGCSAADFQVATSLDSTLNSGFPRASYAVADLNGDGKPDIALADASANALAVLLNDGSGRFGPPRKFAVGSQPRAVAIGDFNGDGLPDLAVANSESNHVSILLNSGAGVFGAASNFAVGTAPAAITVGDLNGDGKMDLAVGNVGSNGDGSVSVLLGNGLGSFATAPGSPIALNVQAVSIAIADFNSDGKRDLAVAAFGGLFLLTGDGTGSFAPAKIYEASGASVATGDFNNDGKPDLAFGSNSLVVLLGNGIGGFSAPSLFPYESRADTSYLVTADVDGDGKQDIATATEFPSGVSFFKGDGAGGFTATRSYLTSANMSKMALGDFDTDGDLDIVAGTSILTNTGGGVFEAARAVYTSTGTSFSGAPSDLALGDFNADGRADMAVTLGSAVGPQPGRMTILLRDAAGNFTPASSIAYNLSSLNSVVAGDFNRDGRADLAVGVSVAIPFSFMVSIQLSNGDGTFTAGSNINVAQQTSDIAIGDLNNDGDPDLVVAGINDNIRIMLGNGAGGFNVPTLINTGASFSRVAIADLNGDTFRDVIVTDYHGQRALTFLGNGAGSFTSSTIIPLGTNATAVASADFNGDGKRDLAIGSPSFNSVIDGNLTVFLGDGAGAFSAPVNYAVGQQPESIVTADFDNDGKTDLAVANQASSSISVLSGDGTGLFHAPVSFNIWGGPGQLVVDDFNADGRLDLATPLSQSAAVGLLFGKAPRSEPCLSADDLTVTEGDFGSATAEVTLHLSGEAAQAATVNYVLKPASATESVDYITASGVVTFQAGETTKTVPVQILGDLLDESNESLTLNLSGAVNARISDARAQINITDNDPPPTISVSDASVAEGNFGTTTANFVISLSAPSSKTIRVDFATASGTASVTEDFDQFQNTVFFNPGVTSQTISTSVRGDLKHEADETFFLNLTNPGDATLGDAQGQATILNDDPLPTISAFDRSATETVGSDTVITFAVRLSNPTSDVVTVDFASADGTATAGSDYTATTGTLTFSDGQIEKTFNVTVKDDLIDEADETLFINFSNATNATISDPQAQGNIFDNDGPTVSINDVSISEGSGVNSSATFTLTLSAVSPQTVFVRVGTANGTANSNFDYQSVGQRTVAIPAGSISATTPITVIGDEEIESNETFFVNLSQPTNCTIADGQGIGTIINDDITSVQFSTAALSVNESATKLDVTVLRVGDLSQPSSAFYFSGDDTASQKSDYNAARGSVQFAAGESSKTFTVFITDDAFVEGPETFILALTGPNNGRPNSPSTLIVTINSDDTTPGPNKIDDSSFFVRQHYRDFLNRDPDAEGLAFWVNEIESCGADAQCRDIKRTNVSAAFFLSIEFQETGYLVYRSYKAAYGDATSTGVAGTVPIIRLTEFLSDTQRVSFGVQVGIGNWQQQLEDNKNAYLLEFVKRARFITAFPLSMTAAEFVAKLDLRAGGVLSADEQQQLVALLETTPADSSKRAAVLRKVAEDSDLNQRELQRAFVLMQYYGYMRRNPDDPQDTNFGGWKFWLDKLNLFNGNFVEAQMVKSFLVSGEYRNRFGN